MFGQILRPSSEGRWSRFALALARLAIVFAFVMSLIGLIKTVEAGGVLFAVAHLEAQRQAASPSVLVNAPEPVKPFGG